METVFDWVTVALFAGLIVLFLQRSTQDEPGDHLWQYMVASVGLAVSNYLGNEDQELAGLLMLGAVLAFVQLTLKPFARQKP